MVSRIESNDPMTAEHCRAVSAWCVRIAQRLALPRHEAAFVARGGLIHDVGKSITPLEILQAPRKLTADEWIIMREHVTEGDDIVRGHQHLRDFSPSCAPTTNALTATAIPTTSIARASRSRWDRHRRRFVQRDDRAPPLPRTALTGSRRGRIAPKCGRNSIPTSSPR